MRHEVGKMKHEDKQPAFSSKGDVARNDAVFAWDGPVPASLVVSHTLSTLPD